MCKYEATRDQYAEFVSASGYELGTCSAYENGVDTLRRELSFQNLGYRQEGNHPAVCVSWDDAQSYAAWLSKKTGKAYRLLTEAEWEYAARAGTTSRYHFGDASSKLCDFANGPDQTAKAARRLHKNASVSCKDGHVYAAPVGSYKPNAFGLYDMHGNVFEWVEDCYTADCTNPNAPANPP